MNKLKTRVHELALKKRKALVAFITAGFPAIDTTFEVAGILAENGADILEIGVPFSDPMADGPTIQESSEIAISNGINLKKIFSLTKKITEKYDIPLVLMSYLNPIFSFGLKKAAAEAEKSGVAGFIIPDMIPEENGELKEIFRRKELSLIHLVAPNTPESRFKYIDDESDSFVYVVSSTGVTGKKKFLMKDTVKYLERTKKLIKSNKRYVGFGISNPKQVLEIKDYVDGVIVGSALIEIIKNNKNKTERNNNIKKLFSSLRNALDKA